MRILYLLSVLVLLAAVANHPAGAAERSSSKKAVYHVSVKGDDNADGTAAHPLRTISAAALRAQPGDTITVHEGVYREAVNPPRGGLSDSERIVYQAAKGDTVEIKGSEVITSWEKVQNDTWKANVSNQLFGDYNPYQDLIHGDWFYGKERNHHTGAVYLNGTWLMEAAEIDEVMSPISSAPLWFAEVNSDTTTIWAQFKDVNPNEELVEINVRQTVFYPQKPGMNYITVRGFMMRHAATQWAPPTAVQVGLLGTHWSKGWIIENNIISHSKCTGITLGKYGDQWDNTSQDTAEGYVLTIERALKNGWSRENIGGHIVRHNTISHCEQSGLVGSLGAVFSQITDNTIHDIHVHCLFTGAEMAGIKIHAAIDVEIARNRIFRTVRGIWLDWMAQGTRVTNNLLYDNTNEDLFVEVDHGPFLVDNNLFLSKNAILDMSEGGAYVHNLLAGRILHRPELSRETPYHKAHSTEVAGLHKIPGGDDRFYNNILVNGNGLAEYDGAALPVWMAGNVFLHAAVPGKHERSPLVLADFDPGIQLVEAEDNATLHIALDKAWRDKQDYMLVTTELLGRAKIPDLPYIHPDDSPYRINRDYFGKKRNEKKPFPGPFELKKSGPQKLQVWPIDR